MKCSCITHTPQEIYSPDFLDKLNLLSLNKGSILSSGTWTVTLVLFIEQETLHQLAGDDCVQPLFFVTWLWCRQVMLQNIRYSPWLSVFLLHCVLTLEYLKDCIWQSSLSSDSSITYILRGFWLMKLAHLEKVLASKDRLTLVFRTLHLHQFDYPSMMVEE